MVILCYIYRRHLEGVGELTEILLQTYGGP